MLLKYYFILFMAIGFEICKNV